MQYVICVVWNCKKQATLLINRKMNGLETYITCPYNHSHRILKARFPQHLTKCSKNFPKNTKVTCIYDVTHRLDPNEYQHHLTICPTSGNVKCYETLLEPDQEVGTIPIQAACNIQTNTMNEDWFGNNPTYDPLAATERKQVLRMAIAMSKSEKKRFKEHERLRLTYLENDKGVDQKVEKACVQKNVENNEPLRQPKNVARAISSYDTSSSIDNISFQLKDISSNKTNDTLMPENSCKLDSNNSMSDEETDLTNNLSNIINTSLKQMNISCNEQKENISNVKNYNCTLHQNMKMEENTSGLKQLKINIKASEKNDSQQKLNKYCTLENQKRVGLNAQKGILYGESKKISTGRGFILACKLSNSDTLKKQEENKKPGASSSTSDYD